jgi:hypothetical protein
LESLNFCPFLRPFGIDDDARDHDDPTDVIAGSRAKIGKGNRGIDLSLQFRRHIDIAPASLDLVGRLSTSRQSQKPDKKKNLDGQAQHRNSLSLAGCSKRLSSQAAASEEARRTLRYVEPLSDARTLLADFFSILLEMIGNAEQDLLSSVDTIKASSDCGLIEP